MWFTQAQEIADENGRGIGRWRMTATSDEDGGGPFGDPSHDHASAKEAEECDRCDEYTSRVTGMPSRRRYEAMKERSERAEYERLKAKFDPPVAGPDPFGTVPVPGGDRPAKDPPVAIGRKP